MDERTLALILQKCLDELDAGATPSEAVRRYPLLEAELRPLLQAGAALRRPPEVPVPSAFLQRLGHRLRQA